MESTNSKKSFKHRLYEFYDKKYRLILIIPFIILFLAFTQIAHQVYTTGDFLIKDVSLKGGVTVTIPYQKELNIAQVEDSISGAIRQDVSVRTLSGQGQSLGIIVEAPIDGTDSAKLGALKQAIAKALSIDLEKTDYGIEIIGSSLGNSFFRESLIALSVAFLFMGIVVFIYFRTYLPSLAIILATISDMAVSLAVVNLMGMEIGTAGIAAFLMLIGYGVDTNILLTVRVLKRKEGTVMDRVLSSVKTGMTMTFVAMLSTIVVLFVAQSDIIKQIMIITLIGLFADIIFTWLQNVSLLRIYLDRKGRGGNQ